MYGFLLNMWIMKKIDKEYLQSKITDGDITEQEYKMIIATPQQD